MTHLTINDILELLLQAGYETVIMVGWSLLYSIILGGLLGLFISLTASPFFIKNTFLNNLGNTLVNIIRSVPFLILMVAILPLGSLIVKSTIGPIAVIFPMTVAATAFFARLSENAFSQVDLGIIEAAVASGASTPQIIIGILLPEALPQLIRHITVTAIVLIGYSSMAGVVGGGGIGDLAIRYGYQRYVVEIMWLCVVLLIIVVQLIQWFGDYLAKKTEHK